MRRFAPDTLRRIGCALFEAVGCTAEDARTFERFVDRIPCDIRARIKYFDSYDPWQWVNADKYEPLTPPPSQRRG